MVEPGRVLLYAAGAGARLLPGPWTPRREGVFLCLVLLGTVRSFWSGQTNLLIFALVALGAMAIADRRWWRAALLLAAPIHIKVWPLAAAGLFVACRPRPLAVRLGVCLLGLGAIPFLTKPFGWVCRQYEGWFALLTGPAQIRHTYRDTWTIWEAIHPPVHPTVYMVLQLTTAAVVLGPLPVAGVAGAASQAAAAVHLGDVGVLATAARAGDRAEHLRPDRPIEQLGTDYRPGTEAGADRDGHGLRADDRGHVRCHRTMVG